MALLGAPVARRTRPVEQGRYLSKVQDRTSRGTAGVQYFVRNNILSKLVKFWKYF